MNDIQRAADRSDELPEEAEDPQVEELQTKDLPIINVSLSGDISEGELQKLARNLEIPWGGITTILGPSGCGKSVTLKHIIGIERADQGRGKDMGVR